MWRVFIFHFLINLFDVYVVCSLFLFSLSFALTTARGNDKTNKRDLRGKQAERHECIKVETLQVESEILRWRRAPRVDRSSAERSVCLMYQRLCANR